jgi:TPP-dependent pyruvate/acetoin dehydrogenase alpha subunit
LTDAQINAWSDEIDVEFAEAVAFAKASPFPRPQSMLDNVYASSTVDGVETRYAA